MFLTGVTASKLIIALGAQGRLTWQWLAAAYGHRRGGEHERYFAGSTDRFELERREREWTRGHSSDGSLLGDCDHDRPSRWRAPSCGRIQ